MFKIEKLQKRFRGESWEMVIQKIWAPQVFGATFPKSLRDKVEVNTSI